MKKFTSTFSLLLLCVYGWSQAGSLETTTFNSPTGYVTNNISSGAADYGNSVVVQSDGKIVVAVITGENIFKVVRYNANGTLDGGFGSGGVVTAYLNAFDEAQSHTVALQSDGKIIVGGYTWTLSDSRDFALIRLNTDGSLDNTFGGAAGYPGWAITQISPYSSTSIGTDVIRSIAVLPDNSIIAAGYSYNGVDNDFAIAKYSANGAIDGSFGVTGTGYTITNVNNKDMVNDVAVTSTGAIVVVGSSNVDNGNATDYAIVRYTSAGALDGTFNTTGKVTSGLTRNDEGLGVAIQSDDYIVITGKIVTSSFSTTDLILARYKTDGTLDATFGTSGLVQTNYSTNTNEEGRGIAIQGDGKIVVGGTTDGASGNYDFFVARYGTTGALDVAFGTSTTLPGSTVTSVSSADDYIYDIALSGSHIYAPGLTNSITNANFALAAYTSSSSSLPVVLSQFSGQKQTSKVVLQWTSATEENVAQYIIERSGDGGATYKAIGQVAAAGTSTLSHSYSYTDASPFTAVNNYYRLKVQDENGSVTYSKILIIKFSGDLTGNLQLFPNPAKDVLQVQIPASFTGSTSLQVYDLSGRVVKSARYTLDGNALNTSIDVSTLPSGIYTLQAKAGNTSTVTRFVKN